MNVVVYELPRWQYSNTRLGRVRIAVGGVLAQVTRIKVEEVKR